AQDSDSVARKIRPNQITNTEKENDITYWKEATKTQSKLQCHLALKRKCSTATYLNTVKDTQLRKTLTMYRLSEHRLVIETDRPGCPERRGCAHNAVWGPWRQRYTSLRNAPNMKPLQKGSFDRFNLVIPNFQTM